VNASNHYSLACSIINLLVVLITTCMTNIFVWKVIGVQVWWGHIIVAVVGLLAYGYIVQWWLSIVINSLLHKLLLRDK